MADPARSLAVLMIEDDAGVAAVVQRHLERRGHTVALAPNAEDGLRQAGARRFDCILLDNGLPGEMGITALPELAAKTEAPIIMITGYPNEDVVKDALLLGAKAFLPKPLDLAELERRIV
ncbi:MAG: response regulator, partial [Elusimicrobia bacterium]|nr:response regulator [Elusimicrobiota bacterium]